MYKFIFDDSKNLHKLRGKTKRKIDLMRWMIDSMIIMIDLIIIMIELMIIMIVQVSLRCCSVMIVFVQVSQVIEG